MSRFLSVDCDPVHQPAATDPIDRCTWSSLGIRIAGRTVTRVWDRALQQERSHLYVPAFPIAEWIVRNWWVLLNEPCPAPEVPHVTGYMSWVKRHCLRCADSALLLPTLYLFNDGRGIGVEWHGLFACETSRRLMTRAYTWDQQASRAFAAELLAPREALRDRAPQFADWAIVEQLAQDFAVSTRVIENQLENAGVAVVEE